MTAESRQHPSPDALAAFGAGRLDGPAAEAVEGHLAGCASCSAALDSLPADDFLSSLRDAYPLAAADDAALPDALRDHPRYRVTGLLGRGGMGAVYRAEHTLMGRTVALKVIAPRLLTQPGAAERFRHEVRAAARLVHRNIVTAYDAEQVGPLTVLVMECVEGRNLADWLRERGPLPPAEACAYVRQAAEGLAYAHAAGTVHRDIKPQNLVLAADGTVKILDFGLSRFVSGEPPAPEAVDSSADTASGRSEGLTDGGALMGTLDYMAPEQARDPRLADAQSDVYALGATLYTLLTGTPAFGGRTGGEKLDAVRTGRFPRPRSIRADVPPPLEAVCLRAMALTPADRYPTAHALAADIDRWLAGEPVTAYRESPAARLRRWVRRHARLATGLAAALAAGGLALGLIAGQRERAQRAVTGERGERDRARAARQVTREALDAMVSGVTGDSLETQAALSEEQKKFLNSVLSYYQEFAAEPGEGRAGRERLAAAHDRLALIRYRLGQRDESAAVFARAAELYGGLAADFPDVPAYRERQARCHNGRGNPLRELGRRAEAEASFRAALAIQETLAADLPTVPDYRQAAALSHYNLSLVLTDLGRLPDAETEVGSALAIQAKLVADFPAGLAYRHDLARSQNGLGNLLGGLGRRAEAEVPYRAALESQKKLAADFPAVAAYRQELVVTHTNLGNLLRGLGRSADAEAEYRAVLAVQAKLATDFPAVPAYRQVLAVIHNNLATVLMATGRPAEAEAEYRAAVAVQEKLADDLPDVPSYRSDLARSHSNLGVLLGRLGRPAEAEAAFRAALAVQAKLAADLPASPAVKQVLAASHTNLGNLLGERGQPAEADAEYRAAVALYEQLAADQPGVPDYRGQLATTQHSLAYRLAEQGRLPEAEAAYRAALAHRTKLAADYPAVPAYRLAVARTAAGLGGVLIQTGRVAEAVRMTEAILDGPAPPADVLFNGACVFALAAAAANNPDADAHATRAAGLLKRVIAQGDRDVSQLLKDTDLDALRRRTDYADLLWEIADGVPTQER